MCVHVRARACVCVQNSTMIAHTHTYTRTRTRTRTRTHLQWRVGTENWVWYTSLDTKKDPVGGTWEGCNGAESTLSSRSLETVGYETGSRPFHEPQGVFWTLNGIDYKDGSAVGKTGNYCVWRSSKGWQIGYNCPDNREMPYYENNDRAAGPGGGVWQPSTHGAGSTIKITMKAARAEPGDLIVDGCGSPELQGVYKRSFPVSSTRILLEGAKGAAAKVNGEYHLCNGTKNGRKNYIKDGVLLATSLSNIN